MLYTQNDILEAVLGTDISVQFNGAGIEFFRNGKYIFLLPTALPSNKNDLVSFIEQRFSDVQRYVNQE
jgi:hypothetical protein